MDTERIKQLAQQHGFSEGAVIAVAEAMRRGNGKMAQFNHPELGGSGQWMPGMLMIGDMFNNSLKARVQALCDALVGEVDMRTPLQNMEFSQMEQWWGDDMGTPTTAGSQNEAHYAYFAAKNRLAVKRDGKVYLYNTGTQVIVGVMQQQSNSIKSLIFQTNSGSAAETDFELLETRPA